MKRYLNYIDGSWRSGDVGAWVPNLNPARTDDVLVLRSDAFLLRSTNFGVERAGGGAFERPFIQLILFGGEGLLVRVELFDLDHEAEALARLDELTSQVQHSAAHPEEPPPSRRRLEGRVRPNAATENLARLDAAIVARDARFSCDVVERDAAKKLFADKGEVFKLELIDAIPEGDEIRIYSQETWLDLCRGPHMTSTGKVGKAFKLLKIAGAYWRGDSNRPMLQRIYGTAWATEEQLAAYLHQIEEAEKRDHRRLGR